MSRSFEHLTDTLGIARQQAGLSQRELGARTGLTQAQISKIENALVDPRISTLIELTRALGHELVLVPRARVPIVKRLLDSGEDTAAHAPRPLYTLDDGDD